MTSKPVDATFERFLYQYGISAGMWNEGGSGLLIIIPLTANAQWFEELEFKLIQALRDYSSIPTLTNQV